MTELVEVKVQSAHYLYQGNTYKKGATFTLPADPESWSSGVKGSISRGNLIVLGAPSKDAKKPKAVDNAAKGQVEVDLGAVSSEAINEPLTATPDPMDNFPDPMTTDVTGKDFIVPEGMDADTARAAGTNPAAAVLQGAVKKSTSQAAAKPKKASRDPDAE